MNFIDIKPNTRCRRDTTVELSCVQNSQLVDDTFVESQQICQQGGKLHHVSSVNAPVGSRELVANCVHTADATKLSS